jgi:hypothetical protein
LLTFSNSQSSPPGGLRTGVATPTPGLRRSVVMSVSSVGDPEGGQRTAGVAGVVAERGGEVDRPRSAEDTDDQVAPGRP